MTQLRAFGAFTGARYGSFAGKTQAGRSVGELTQPRAFGAFTGKRYGSFSGRAEAGRDVGTLTQARAFGAMAGRRYGAFSGRTASVAPSPIPQSPAVGPSRRIKVDRLLAQQLEEDELILLVISSALRCGMI